jgi:hypothetical protein
MDQPSARVLLPSKNTAVSIPVRFDTDVQEGKRLVLHYLYLNEQGVLQTLAHTAAIGADVIDRAFLWC